jgi:hypothetical protein
MGSILLILIIRYINDHAAMLPQIPGNVKYDPPPAFSVAFGFKHGTLPSVFEGENRRRFSRKA